MDYSEKENNFSFHKPLTYVPLEVVKVVADKIIDETEKREHQKSKSDVVNSQKEKNMVYTDLDKLRSDALKNVLIKSRAITKSSIVFTFKNFR